MIRFGLPTSHGCAPLRCSAPGGATGGLTWGEDRNPVTEWRYPFIMLYAVRVKCLQMIQKINKTDASGTRFSRFSLTVKWRLGRGAHGWSRPSLPAACMSNPRSCLQKQTRPVEPSQKRLQTQLVGVSDLMLEDFFFNCVLVPEKLEMPFVLKTHVSTYIVIFASSNVARLVFRVSEHPQMFFCPWLFPHIQSIGDFYKAI